MSETANDSTRRHLTHVARGGAIGLVGAAVSAISGFVLVLIVTNRFPADTAGRFFTVTSAFLLMSAIAALGTETGLGRFLLRHERTGRAGDVRATLRTAYRPTLACSVLVGAAVAIWAAPIADLIGIAGSGGAGSLRVLAATLPFATWGALALAGTRAFGRMRTTVLVDKIGRAAAQPLLVLLVSYTSAELMEITLAWAIPFVVAALASSVLFRRYLSRRTAAMTQEQATPDREIAREFWSFTWPRAITRISQMAIQRLDIVLIAVMLGPIEAAIYTAATRFVALGQFGTQAIQQVLQPKFTALLADDDPSLRPVYQISTAWSMGIAWPMYVTVGATPIAYLALFGPQYVDEGVLVVILMSVAMLFAVATGPADTLLLMSGRSSLSLINSLVALAIDIVLCVVLIPQHGIVGAAIAWAIAVSTRATLCLLQVRRTLGIISFSRPAFVVAIANLVCVGVPLIVLSAVVEPNLWMVLGVLALALPAYAAVLWLGRHELQLDVLRGLVRRRRSTTTEESVDE